jgi:hypothetical protein
LSQSPYIWWNEALHGVEYSDGLNFGVGFSVVTEDSVKNTYLPLFFSTHLLFAPVFDDELIY